MTENQEKELFTTLAALVKGVNKIQTDVEQIKETQEEHSQILKKLDAKTDSIAETVLNHEIRITKLEKDVSDSHKGVH